MKVNFKRLGFVLFLLIAVAGFSMSSVCAGGEGDKVGEPNTLAIAFINTYHGHSVAVNGIQYQRKMYVMMWLAYLHITEYNKDHIPIFDKELVFSVTSSDFIKKFNSETTFVKVGVSAYYDDSNREFWNLPADGSHYGGVCINNLGCGADNFRIVGNHFDTGWKKF